MWSKILSKMRNAGGRCVRGAVMTGIAIGAGWAQSAASAGTTVRVNPAKMTKLTIVDPRFVSYNVEMVEVTGGRFWKPYSDYCPSPKFRSAVKAIT
jgi:hypothetical protein